MASDDAYSMDGASSACDGQRAAQELRLALAECAAAVRRFLFAMCGDWHLAEDLAQEALLKAWSNRGKFAGRCCVRTWVFTIARNHWLDALRRRRTAPWEEAMNENLMASSQAPAERMWRSELAGAVRLAMDKLPADQREALALRESEGLSFKDVAEILDIPVATAKSRVRYALLKLADELRPLQSEMGGSES